MRRRNFNRGRGRRRPTQWVASTLGYGGALGPITAGTPLAANLVGTTGTGATFDPPVIQRFTVERVEGDIAFTSPANGANGIVLVGLGIILVTESKGGAVVPIPDPLDITDAGQPWLWLRHIAYQQAGGDSAVSSQIGGLGGPVGQSGLYVRTKTKRVVHEEMRLLLCVNTGTLVGAGVAVTVYPALRTLISRVA